jgi:hypothetical protein
MGTCCNGYPWIQRVYDITEVFLLSAETSMNVSCDIFTFDLAKIFHLNNRNPLYLLVIFVVYLVGKAIWVQSEIGREFQHGFVSIEITHFSVKTLLGQLNILI